MAKTEQSEMVLNVPGAEEIVYCLDVTKVIFLGADDDSRGLGGAGALLPVVKSLRKVRKAPEVST